LPAFTETFYPGFLRVTAYSGKQFFYEINSNFRIRRHEQAPDARFGFSFKAG
jgi:hypothetical protein